MKESEIRDSLLQYVYKVYKDALVFNELGVCNGEVIIDIAVFNSHVLGFEIKSQADDLRRLPKQIEVYNKVFDYVTIIVPSCHIENVSSLIPHWWGILRIDKNKKKIFHNHRDPKNNPKINLYNISQWFWKDEIISILKKRNLSKGISYKKRDYLIDVLIKNYSKIEIVNLLKECFVKRMNWQVDLTRRQCDEKYLPSTMSLHSQDQMFCY